SSHQTHLDILGPEILLRQIRLRSSWAPLLLPGFPLRRPIPPELPAKCGPHRPKLDRSCCKRRSPTGPGRALGSDPAHQTARMTDRTPSAAAGLLALYQTYLA